MDSKAPLISTDAEKQVLSAMLISRQAVITASEMLVEDDFYFQGHRNLFAAMTGLHSDGLAVDVITVANRLKENGTLDEENGMSYLVKLLNNAVTAANIESHCRIVIDKSVKRQETLIGLTLQKSSYDETAPPLEAADKIIEQFSSLQKRYDRQSFKTFTSLMEDSFNTVMNGEARDIVGITTGFPSLDDITLGYQKEDLIIIAGRPSHGKTAFGVSSAFLSCCATKSPVGIISIEMPAKLIAERILSGKSGVPLRAIRTNRLTDVEKLRLIDTQHEIAELPIVIDDDCRMTAQKIHDRVKKMVVEHNVEFVVIDYLQLIKGQGRSRDEEVSSVSKSLKETAREFKIPIIALAQLNREIEKRSDKKPIAADLGYSGALEQDADIIITINQLSKHRIEFYDDGRPTKDMLDVDVLKSRNGAVGGVRMRCEHHISRITELAGGEWDV